MKKVILLSIALILCNLAFGYHFEDNGFYYFLKSENPATVEVTMGENAYSGSINIPSTVNYYGKSYNVVSIGSQAFKGCTALTTVTIPNTVTELGSEAFSGCTSLSSVYLSNALKSINSSAFYGCSSLLTISFPESVTSINSAAFSGCTSLSTIDIPITISNIGENAFENTPWYNSKPDGFVMVHYIFYRYKGVMPSNSKIAIPGGIISISNQAFIGYKNMTEITIPNSVTTIGGYAFQNCTGLTNLSLPNSVKTIGHYSFSGCTALTTLNIPNSVTDIGRNAFTSTQWYNNQPDGVIYINKVAYKFKGVMPQNNRITIMEGSVSISGEAFNNYANLSSISIPGSVEVIGPLAFYNCKGLNSITLPENITKIDYSTFYGCTSLVSISIPNSVLSIGTNAFNGCTSMKSIVLPSNLEIIDDYAFNNTGLTSIIIPNAVRSIGMEAFHSCSQLEYIDIPGTVITNFVKNSFGVSDIISGCLNLNTIKAPAEVFCTSSLSKKLINLKINGGILSQVAVKNIQGSYQCLKKIDLTGILNTELFDESFSGFYNLDTIIFPSNLTRVPYKFVAGCLQLKQVTIPSTVTELDMSSFENCRSLKSIVFEGNSHLKKIDNWAFYACHLLDSINIPNGVETIGNGAFWGCNYLKSLTIPSSVSSIGDNGFDGCKTLTTIRSEALVPPVVDENTFNEVDKNIPVIVPDESFRNYQVAFGWKEFRNIKPMSLPKTDIDPFFIYTQGRNINIEKVTSKTISVFDLFGEIIYEKQNVGFREVLSVPQTGVFFVKVGNKVQKVLVR